MPPRRCSILSSGPPPQLAIQRLRLLDTFGLFQMHTLTQQLLAGLAPGKDAVAQVHLALRTLFS